MAGVSLPQKTFRPINYPIAIQQQTIIMSQLSVPSKKSTKKSNKVSRKKYNKLVDLLESERCERGRLQVQWDSERVELVEQIQSLSVQVSECQDWYQGCNQVVTAEYDGWKLNNSAQMNTVLKSKVFPHIKFPSAELFKYDPENPRSFYNTAGRNAFECPNGVVLRVYWAKSIVPLAGKRVQELRSNANEGHRSAYLGL